MQFSTFALFAALSIGSALAQDAPITVHVVTVGGANAALQFFPSRVVANVGDMVQFQFKPKNHSVVQSTFDNPCAPISLHSNATGVFSGYVPVAVDAEVTGTYTIMVTDKKPMWLYCSQAKHCQSGMTMVINENPSANSTKTLENYTALAALQTENLAPAGAAVSGGASNGTSGTTSGTGSSGTSGTSGGSGTTSSDTPIQSTNVAPALKVSSSVFMAGLLAVVMALFV